MNEASDASESEAGNPAWVTRLGAWLSPLVFLGLWFLPLPLEPNAHRLAAIGGAVLVAWVTEVIPVAVTALLIAPAVTLAQISPAKQAFAPYADPILFLFVGTFFAARAMSKHGLDRRFALSIASLPFVAGRPARVRAALIVGAMLVSMWISNTGTTAILLPVLLGMLPERGGTAKKLDTFAAGSLLALAHASTTGGLATIVGTPPNAVTARLLAAAGHPIGFLAWMKIGVPIMLVLTLCVYLLIARFLPAGDTQIVTGMPSELGPWSRAEKVTALSFALAILGWVVPDLSNVLNLSFAPTLAKMLDPGAVAVLAASILFMVPNGKDGERVLMWRDAVQIEWGMILLFGGGIALGEAMFATGLAKVLGEGFIALTGVSSLWALTASSIVLAVVLTEICSNTAAANMLVPLVIGAAEQLGVSPIPPALAVGFGASCGFMLPVATGPNALVYGTGYLRARDMIRVGVGLDLVSAAVIFVLLYLLCPLFGWT